MLTAWAEHPPHPPTPPAPAPLRQWWGLFSPSNKWNVNITDRPINAYSVGRNKESNEAGYHGESCPSYIMGSPGCGPFAPTLANVPSGYTQLLFVPAGGKNRYYIQQAVSVRLAGTLAEEAQLWCVHLPAVVYNGQTHSTAAAASAAVPTRHPCRCFCDSHPPLLWIPQCPSAFADAVPPTFGCRLFFCSHAWQPAVA